MAYRATLREWLELARSFVAVACLLAALIGFAAAVLSGVHVASILLLPIALLAWALSSPQMLMLIALVVLAVHGLLLTGGLVVAALRRSGACAAADAGKAALALPAEAALRRRYLAGEIEYREFRTSMLALLKERCVSGDLALPEYEQAVARLLEPARRLGVEGAALVARPPEASSGKARRAAG